MPNYTALSKTRHAGKRWLHPSDHGHAAHNAVAHLVVQELPTAVMSLPVAFVATDGQFRPVAVLGLAPGQNLFLNAERQWHGAYLPAAYRAHPFAVARSSEGQPVLCIDEDSGLLSDTEGEPLFDADGTPSASVRQVSNFLSSVQASRDASVRVCALLQKHRLIQPWAIKGESEHGEQTIEGLYRIDESALNALPPEAFLELRQDGALLVAHCQLLSMQHLPRLGRLAQMQAQAAPAAEPLSATPNGELDLEFLKNGGTISFS